VGGYRESRKQNWDIMLAMNGKEMKQYLYWRTPKGKSDRVNAPTHLLAEFGRISKVNSQGEVSWEGFSFKRLEIAIKLIAVVIGPDGEELDETDTWCNIVEPALIDAVKKNGGEKPLRVDEVTKIADTKAAKFFQQKNETYILVSSLSVKSLPFKEIKVAGCMIKPLCSRRGYSYPDQIQDQVSTTIAEHINTTKYQHVMVKTSGRSIYEAADKALRSLHFLRGLWSFFATNGSWSMTLGRTMQEPIGVIFTGPIHTLHNMKKELSCNEYWYSRIVKEDRNLFPTNGNWGKIEKNRRLAMKLICSLPFMKDMEDLIIRYATVLDQTDHDVAFLHLWSMLEKITNTVGANYDETLKRSTWIYKDRHFTKNLLESLRLQRNLYVHSARSSEEPDQVLYLMKSFVDNHLIRLIRNDFHVESLEEYGQVLSQPTDLATLEKNKKRAEQALRFLSQRKKK